MQKGVLVHISDAGMGNNNFKLLYLGKDSPLIIQGTSFGGGSGWGYRYYIFDNGKVSEPFEMGNWQRGELFLKDIDGCGLAEIVSMGGRTSSGPGIFDDLEKKGIKSSSADMYKLSRNSIAKWRKGKLWWGGKFKTEDEYFFYGE